MGAVAIASSPLSNPTTKMLSFLRCKLRVNPKFPNPSPSFSPIFSSLHSNPTPKHTQATATATATPQTLSSIFTSPPLPRRDAIKRDKKRVPSSGPIRYRPTEEKEFPKELSTEAASLVRRLQDEGYLNEASFSRVGLLGQDEIPPNSYSRHFLKSAAEKFGQDHQEIAKWLSGSELKKVALFGCPSVERGTIFAAKRLRAFFKIQEDTTCRACKMKNSCKFANQRVGGQDKLILADVMRVLSLFALDAVPRQLFISADFRSSVRKLLKEVVSLSS